ALPDGSVLPSSRHSDPEGDCDLKHPQVMIKAGNEEEQVGPAGHEAASGVLLSAMEAGCRAAGVLRGAKTGGVSGDRSAMLFPQNLYRCTYSNSSAQGFEMYVSDFSTTHSTAGRRDSCFFYCA